VSAIPEHGTGRLLFYLEQRLAQLRWTRGDLADHGGPSPSTVYKSLTGGRTPTARTLAKLEIALGWDAGSSQRILFGEAPALAIHQQMHSVSLRIDTQLARGEALGVRQTAAELRDFLLDVAGSLERFYTAELPVTEALDARTG
jgi:hypothetical protein